MGNIERIEFNLSAWRDEWGSMAMPVDKDPGVVSRLQRIEGTATVYGDIDWHKLEQLAALVKARCPVASMVVASGCELDVAWRHGAHSSSI